MAQDQRVALRCGLPYRIDIHHPRSDAFDLLVELGALDAERVGDGLAAILPDSVTQDSITALLAPSGVIFSDAVGRDEASVWLLNPREVRAGGYTIRLTDSDAFGTGHHPTTVLCIEALEEILRTERPDSLLDVGTGSGVLAIAALLMGVPRATGIDIDAGALQAAADNARINDLSDRLELSRWS